MFALLSDDAPIFRRHYTPAARHHATPVLFVADAMPACQIFACLLLLADAIFDYACRRCMSRCASCREHADAADAENHARSTTCFAARDARLFHAPTRNR